MNVDVSDFMLHYPKIKSKNFQEDINRLAEFYTLKLKPQESLSEKQGNYLQHQEMARRLINNETPYSKMLFEHEPGTGKTCLLTAINEWNIAEKQRLSGQKVKNIKRTNENFEKFSKRPIIFVSNRTQEYNLSKMIAKNCLPDKYANVVLEENDDLSDKSLTRKYQDVVARDYRFETLQKFSHKILEHDRNGEIVNVLSDKAIQQQYDDRTIFIDEAHHLRITSEKKEESIVYHAFWRLLHVARNIKVIMLTGTPESDKAEDFAYLLNLILPEDEQLPIKNYEKIMFTSEGQLSEIGKAKLIKAITGRVSFLRATTEASTKVTENGRIDPWEEGKYKEWTEETGFDTPEDEHPWTHSTKLVPLVMSDFQREVLEESEEKRTTHKRKDVEVEGVAGGAFGNFEKDASIFVWPDKTYGAEGFKKHVTITEIGGKDSVIARDLKILTAKSHTYQFKSLYGAEVKKNLWKYSAKFYKIIEDLRELQKTGGKAFIFAPHVEGGGLNLLIMFMKSILGYEEGSVIQDWKRKTKKLRYIILSGVTSGTDLQLIKLLDTFNAMENNRGQYINVVLGTEKVAEGITFYGIRAYYSFRADYKRKFILQSEKRGNRLGSHDQLPPEERTMEINRLVVGSSNEEGYFFPFQTRDIYIYRQIEIKNSFISEQKRLRKQYAVDCVWNYARNVQNSDKNFSTECDNKECNYICAEALPEYIDKSTKVWKYDYPSDYLNYNNYNLLYSQNERKEIIQQLQILFQQEIRYSYGELQKRLKKHNSHLLLQTLTEIIDNNIIMYTRYGTIAYLHEENGEFFIDNMLSSLPKLNKNGDQYTQNLYTSNSKTLNELNAVLDNDDCQIVHDFCNAKSNEERLEALKKSSGNLLQTFVETYFLTLRAGKKYESNAISDFFEKFIYRLPQGCIVHYLEIGPFDAATYSSRTAKLTADSKLRCLGGENNIWTYCSAPDKKIFIKEIKKMKESSRNEKFVGKVSAYGKKHPDGIETKFRLVRNIPMETICYQKNRDELIRTVGQLNIKFPEGDREESFQDGTYDSVQNDNISLMLGLFATSQKEVCDIIVRQLKEKKALTVRLLDTAKKELTKQEMINLTIEYDIPIKNPQKTTLLDIQKMGYKGGELAPHTMQSLLSVYRLWNEKKNKIVLNNFRSSVKNYIENVETWYNSYNSKTSGSVCHQLHKTKMIRTVLDIGNPDDMADQRMTREQMLLFIQENDTGFIEEELEEFNNKQLNTIVYIFKPGTNKAIICRYLYKVLSEKGLMFD